MRRHGVWRGGVLHYTGVFGSDRTLERIAKDRTVVSVTHRLANVVHADRLFVFHQGRLAEQGRHGELLARQALYARLWHKQAGFLTKQG